MRLNWSRPELYVKKKNRHFFCRCTIGFDEFVVFKCDLGRDEKGLFYGVNLRGENFLILRARLGGKNEPISELQREEISIPTDVMAASSKVVNFTIGSWICRKIN